MNYIPRHKHKERTTQDNLQKRTFNLCRASLGTLFVRLRLGNAAVLDFFVALYDRSQLCVSSVLVTGKLSDFLVQSFEFLCLVLDILDQSGFGDLVFLCCGLVLLSGVRLSSLLGRQVLGEVALANFKDSDDAPTNTR